MEKELVSVVITTYKRNDFLRRAISSVLQQTYSNFEIIVVDDNIDLNYRKSVCKIISEFNDQRIKLICNEENLGGALARNVGIKEAKGKYVAFLDDDDAYFPEKLRLQLELFEKSTDANLGLVYCYCVGCDENGVEKVTYQKNHVGRCVYEAMKDCVAATSQWMCLKSALEDVGGFSDVPCKQDSTLIMKLLIKGYILDRVPVVLSKYYDYIGERISDHTKSNKRIEGEEKLRTLCRQNYDLISKKEQKEVEYFFACRLCIHYYLVKNKVAFRRTLKTILWLHPLSRMSIQVYKDMFRKRINRE